MATAAQQPSMGGIEARHPDLQRALGYRSSFKFIREFRADPLAFFAMLRDHADVAPFKWGTGTIVYLFHPEAARHVLQENHRNYRKEVGSGRIFRTLLGDGIFLSDGDRWLKERRAAQPAFHKKKIAGLTELMTNAIGEMIERWDQVALDGETLNVGSETIKLAMAVVSRSLFSTDLTTNEDTLSALMTEAFEYLNHRLYHPLSAPLFVPTRRNLRM